MTTSSKTPLLDTIASPFGFAAPEGVRSRPSRGRTARRDDRCGLGDGRPSRRGAWCGRAYGCSSLCFRHAERPVGLGRWPPSLPAQDSHRAARPDPDLAPGRWLVGVHQTLRERIRSFWRRAFLDIDLRRPRNGGGQHAIGQENPRRLRNRGWRDVRRHGLRGDEQCRRHAFAADHRS